MGLGIKHPWTNCAMAFVFLAISVAWTASGREFSHRLYYAQGRPGVNPDDMVEHLKRAAAAGYNGAVITDGELATLEAQPQASKDGYAKIFAAAKQHGITPIPGFFASSSGAETDHMLAEASPVRGTPFKVENGKARCKSDHDVGLKNGDFESFTGSSPTHWKLGMLAPGTNCFQDKAIKRFGTSALRIGMGIKAGSYISQRITLKPYRAYRISAWFKTDSLAYTRGVQFQVYGQKGTRHKLLDRRWRPFGTPLEKVDGRWRGVWTQLSRHMNWRKCIADFNSMNNNSATIRFYFASAGYGGGDHDSGTVWMDEMKIEEVGLYEVMRRRNCPVVVKSADGSKVYSEGTDYKVDARCDTFTYDDYWYEGYLEIPSGSSIQSGETLLVDWYKFSDNYLLHSETNFCLPETWKALHDDMQRIDHTYPQKDYMWLSYDEWRGAFMDDRCELFPLAKTAGEYMAGVLRESALVCRRNNPCRGMYVLNDMYDPYHNAMDPYFMCTGGTANSWKDMDTNLIVVNWSSNWEKSLKFYMGLDSLRLGKVNRQLLFCQGGSEVRPKDSLVQMLEAQGGRGVIGFVWCTWYSRWEHLEYTANAFKAIGWWQDGPLPKPGRCVENAERSEPNAGPKVQDMRIQSTAAGYRIGYSLSKYSKVGLRVVDLLGRTVNLVSKAEGRPGRNRIHWDTRRVPAGIYFLKLLVDGKTTNRVKIVVL